MKDFYERVRYTAKKVKNVSLQELLYSVGLNLDSYYTMKKSGNLPRADEAVKIARALGVSVEYLVTGEASENADVLERIQQLACQIIKETGFIQ